MQTMPKKSGEIEAGNELETLQYAISPQVDAFFLANITKLRCVVHNWLDLNRVGSASANV